MPPTLARWRERCRERRTTRPILRLPEVSSNRGAGVAAANPIWLEAPASVVSFSCPADVSGGRCASELMSIGTELRQYTTASDLRWYPD